jgi:hypothetical protein
MSIRGALTLEQFEPFVDSNIRLFYDKMDELFIRPQQPCDIHNWVQYCVSPIYHLATMC